MKKIYEQPIITVMQVEIDEILSSSSEHLETPLLPFGDEND